MSGATDLNPLLSGWGYTSATKQNVVSGMGVATVMTAVAGVAVGIFALYGALSPATALWTQVGSFTAVAIGAGAAVVMSEKVKRTIAVFVAVICVLALPVIFGSLGATGMIPCYDMLWAASAMCGAVVAAGFFTSVGVVAQDCCNDD